MKTQVLILFALVFGTAFNASAKKKEETPAPGLVYSLPRTIVKINVNTQYTQIVAGPYAKYAETYLGIKNAAMHDVQCWHINHITFDTFAEADPAQQYQSLGKGGSLVSLCNNGVIAGINTVAPQKTNELSYSSYIAPKVKKPISNFTNLTMDGRTYTITDSTGAHVFTKTDEEMAQDAANTIIDLRQQRYDLLSGALDSDELSDAQTLQAAADRLNKMEQKYLSLFIGVSYSGNCSFSFDYVPTNPDTDGKVAFRFSEEHGAVPATDLSGAPVMINTKSQSNSAYGFGSTESPSALYYRIPGKAVINLTYGGKTLASAQLELAQFGTIMPIPDQLLDGRYEVKMNTETGAIMGSKQIIFNTDGKKK
ncbi:MAG: DUF4831 family protein [Mangrovibacterium sp.]